MTTRRISKPLIFIMPVRRSAKFRTGTVQRVTLFLPLVEPRQRRKTLRLPSLIVDSNSGQRTDRYLLHHYFEVFADGEAHYSSLYTEEVVTGASAPQAPCDAAPILVKEPVSEVHDQPASAERADS